MTGRFAREQIELRTNAFWRLHWWWALPGALVACVAGGIIAWLLPEVWFPLWMVIPLMVLAGLFALRPLVYGTYHLEMAVEAEAWTSKELRKVCGPGWHVVDGISFAFHDVDHVLVGPGGVYVVETKYTDSTTDLTTRRSVEWAKRSADQAVGAARSVHYLLWHQGRPQVQPLVIVWGGDVHGSPLRCGGAAVLHRRDLGDFVAELDQADAQLSPGQVDTITRRLFEYREARLDHERRAGRRAA